MRLDAAPSVRVAACFRSPFLALALIENHEVSAFRRHYLGSQSRTPAHQAERIAAFAIDYGATEVIVEPGAALSVFLQALGLAATTCTVAAAKRALLGDRDKGSDGDLFNTVIDQHPKLRRLVSVLHAGKVATSERWRTLLLFAVALGLAAEGPLQRLSSDGSHRH